MADWKKDESAIIRWYTEGEEITECDYEGYCLPLIKASELKFQVKAIMTNAEYNQFNSNEGDPNSKQLFATLHDINTEGTTFRNWRFNIYGTPISETHKAVIFSGAYNDDDGEQDPDPLVDQGYQENECFSINLAVRTYSSGGDPEPSDALLYESNCFQAISDSCNTTLIKFSSNEDALNFFYDPNFPDYMQSARFYIRMDRPQFPKKKEGYRRSNGVYKKLFASFEKELQCVTEYFTQELHEKVTMITEHDNILVTSHDSGLTDQAVTCESDYSIDWVDFPHLKTAQAEFSLKCSPYNYKNSNCR